MARQSRLRYEAGHTEPQDHIISVNLIRAGYDEGKSGLITRFVEFWCQKQCRGPWRVEETDRTLSVSFALPRDRVIFQISEEYGYFQR